MVRDDVEADARLFAKCVADAAAEPADKIRSRIDGCNDCLVRETVAAAT